MAAKVLANRVDELSGREVEITGTHANWQNAVITVIN